MALVRKKCTAVTIGGQRHCGQRVRRRSRVLDGGGVTRRGRRGGGQRVHRLRGRYDGGETRKCRVLVKRWRFG